MSFLTIAQCAADVDMNNRMTACVASEGDSVGLIPVDLTWFVASRDDIEAAFESAVLAGHETPGADPAVVTDQMILSAVQAFVPPGP